MAIIAKAIYAFQGSEEGDLSFREDDIIKVLRKDESGWWEGQTDDGRRGDFPYNYVEIISDRDNQGQWNQGPSARRQQGGGRSKADKVSKAKVSPQANSATFLVELHLARKKIQGSKGVGDFRALDDTLRVMYPNFDRPLPPMWADKVAVSGNSKVNQNRARVLELYLKKLLGSEGPEYTLVSWMNPKASFNASPDIKAFVTESLRQGTQGMKHRNSTAAALQSIKPLARFKFDWTATDAVELTVAKGDVVAVTEKNTASSGWWEGESIDGQRGLFPANYVELLSSEEAKSIVLGGPSAPGASRRVQNTGPSYSSSTAVGAGYSSPMASNQNQRKYNTDSSLAMQRKRRTEEGFSMPTLDAFDELLTDGFTMLTTERGKASVFTPRKNAQAPSEGDKVTLSYAGYVWDSQKQRLIEFAASDLHEENSGGDFLRFVVGKGETIKGLERAVQNLESGQASRIVVKPELGYGEVGNPPNVPPNCHLVYDIKLEAFERASMPGPPGSSMGGPAFNNLSGPNALADAIGRQNSRFGASQGAWNADAPVNPRPKKPHNKAAKPQFKVAAAGSQPGNQRKPVAPKKYSLNKIRQIIQEKSYEAHQVNPALVEDHLKESDFLEAFNVDRPSFLLMQKWRRNKLKKDAGLN